MKAIAFELPSGKNTILNSYKKAVIPILSLVLLTSITLYQHNNSASSSRFAEVLVNSSIPLPLLPKRNTTLARECNIFSGNWVPYSKGPYYTNETKCVIDDRQNCMKYGRPDTEFMKWRWKPDDCELPLFNAVQFLELVRGKTLAFVGDSVGRNQMQSLVCLLASAATPVDVTNVYDTKFRRWFYADFNFTIATYWAPLLVKTREPDPNGHPFPGLMNLYLDEADDTWPAQVESADFVIISAGQWFFRPFMFYENETLVGCSLCHKENITDLGVIYAYKMAFRTAFRTLSSLRNFTGVTFLRTFSPSHFENGDWNKGGNCVRRRPVAKGELELDWYAVQLPLSQVAELKAAESKGRERGLRFRVLDTTEAMVLRPDGHPNYYGHWPHENKTLADCVHWCMPGPVDTWNEFLLQMLKMEVKGFNDGKKLQKNT